MTKELCSTARFGGVAAITLILITMVGSFLGLVDPASAQESRGWIDRTPIDRTQIGEEKIHMLPSIRLAEFTRLGSGVMHEWKDRTMAVTGDREAVYRSVREILEAQKEFEAEVAKTYPRDQLEWILITDTVSDTLVENLRPVLLAYQDNHPDEILTKGRQLFELAMMKIIGPPPRVLGFHVAMLANYACLQSDSLIAQEPVEHHPGIMEGLLRNLSDWTALYAQVHDTPLSRYESRLLQEDWIINRIGNECGELGSWRVVQQYMAMVGIDSTVTPPVERYAHEFHLKAQDCDDSRIIYVDLPNFYAMQLYILDQSQQGTLGGP